LLFCGYYIFLENFINSVLLNFLMGVDDFSGTGLSRVFSSGVGISSCVCPSRRDLAVDLSGVRGLVGVGVVGDKVIGDGVGVVGCSGVVGDTRVVGCSGVGGDGGVGGGVHSSCDFNIHDIDIMPEFRFSIFEVGYRYALILYDFCHPRRKTLVLRDSPAVYYVWSCVLLGDVVLSSVSGGVGVGGVAHDVSGTAGAGVISGGIGLRSGAGGDWRGGSVVGCDEHIDAGVISGDIGVGHGAGYGAVGDSVGGVGHGAGYGDAGVIGSVLRSCGITGSSLGVMSPGLRVPVHFPEIGFQIARGQYYCRHYPVAHWLLEHRDDIVDVLLVFDRVTNKKLRIVDLCVLGSGFAR
jgi:hypothetical protein